jgi:hypothetical protein
MRIIILLDFYWIFIGFLLDFYCYKILPVGGRRVILPPGICIFGVS